MDCLLFRHGIAMDREDWDGPEAQRPLTSKGVEKTREVVAGLLTLGIIPTHVFSSPFTRALETARIVRDTSRLRGEVQIVDELLPDAPPDKLFPILGSLPEHSRIVCVGHEPHLGEAAGVMVFGKPAGGLSLKKAGVCCVRFEHAPRPGQGMLRWWLTPSQLRRLRRG
jgi:phosphohistidine phosphatase